MICVPSDSCRDNEPRNNIYTYSRTTHHQRSFPFMRPTLSPAELVEVEVYGKTLLQVREFRPPHANAHCHLSSLLASYACDNALCFTIACI
jgi:hypothetical protein